MNALLVLRPDAKSRFGGDTVLAEGTAAALRRLGVSADVLASAEPDPRGRDVAHIFGIFEPEIAARQMQACRSAGVPVVLSPIWLDLRDLIGLARAAERALRKARPPSEGVRELARLRAMPADRLLRGRELRRLRAREALQRELASAANALVLNGAIEARELAVGLGVHGVPFVIGRIPPSTDSFDWSDRRAGVLCVGRIETRKNQALLALALRDCELELTCIGDPYDREYLEVCRQVAGSNVTFTGWLPDGEVRNRLQHALVHAMPSWCETAGISSLDAALAGAQLVVGDRGSELEYFGEDVEYADPADPESIRAAVMRAAARPPRERGDALDQRVRAYTWQALAEETLRGYELAIARM